MERLEEMAKIEGLIGKTKPVENQVEYCASEKFYQKQIKRANPSVKHRGRSVKPTS